MRGFVPASAALLAFATVPALASDDDYDEDRPIEAVEAFMSAFNAKDAAAMSALATDDAIVTVIEERDGDDRRTTTALGNLITSIASSPADIEEPIWGTRAVQQGPVAAVFASFEFLIDGNRSHCGTNIFNLVRVDDEWQIASITYSHVEQDCVEAPKP